MARRVCAQVEVYEAGESIHLRSSCKIPFEDAERLVRNKKAVFRDHRQKMVMFPEPCIPDRPVYDRHGLSCVPGAELIEQFALGSQTAKNIIEAWKV